MALASSKTFVLIQVSLLLVSFCFSAFGTHVSPAPSPTQSYPPTQPPTLPPNGPPVKPPVQPPVKPPVSPPVKPPVSPPPSSPAQPPVRPPMTPPVQPPVSPPVQPPVSPPAYPPHAPIQRRFLAVQGVVYCKSCKYAKVDSLQDATPVAGATVRLTCRNNPKKAIMQEAKTDKKGYFFLQGPKTVTTYAFHKCRVTLVSSQSANCSEPTDLHGGLKGAMLKPQKPFTINNSPFVLFNVGPFAFAPKCSK